MIGLLVSRIGKMRGVTTGFAYAAILAIALTFSPFAEAEPIRGAGSTFAAPIIAKWSKAYQEARADGFGLHARMPIEPFGINGEWPVACGTA
jgi:ABC-type phosphate transport system substrate-binding protein